MLNLRQYQLDAISTIKETFKHSNRQFVEMPTGSGKTVTFLSYASQNHKRILIIVPSKQLLKQIYESSQLFYEANEISRKGNRYNEPIKKVHIVISNSIRGEYLKKLTHLNFDLVIIDEAHHSQANSYSRFINQKTSLFPNQKFLGVTATPDRIDGKLLEELLKVCSYKISINDLINQKYLSDIEGYCIKTNIDISDIDNHNKDFSILQLYKKLNREDRNNLILETYKIKLKDRKTIVFCINVDHSLELKKLFTENGISCAHIDGKVKSAKRNAILSSFRNGETSVLFNCQLLTEGFDEPSINGIILARPTSSKSLFLQMIGRGLRIFPGKSNCKIIDIVDNNKSLTGFNQIITESRLKPIDQFKSIDEIIFHIKKEELKISEFLIERTNILIDQPSYHDLNATDSMIDYLNANEITFFEPISLNEASFLIWLNELKREYDGKHTKTRTSKRNIQLSRGNKKRRLNILQNISNRRRR